MARCGCGGGSCNCMVEAGVGVSVTGTGSTANPYVVSAPPPDCSTFRPCISGGLGVTYNPATGVISARPSTDAGNTLSFGTDGGLYNSADCTTVRACLSGGNGITYDPVTGLISAKPSTDAGNQLTFGGDGGLFVPATGAASLTTGCGLTGTGAPASPLKANTGTWPYTCGLDANGSVIACDSTGKLRGEPRGKTDFTQQINVTNFASVPVPAGTPVTILTDNLNITNPDACRDAFVMTEVEIDVDLTLPANSGGIYSIGGDDMARIENKGTSQMNDIHWQLTKVFRTTVPAGSSVVDPVQVRIGGGFGGSVYTRIQVIHRAFIFVI